MHDKFYLSAALFLIFVLVINLFSPRNQLLQSECQCVYNLKDIKCEFYKRLSLIKEKYPNQTSKFWSNIESSFVYSILKKGGPSIILIVNDKSTSELASKIIADLFEFYYEIFQYSVSKFAKDDLIIDPLLDIELISLINSQKFDAVKNLVDDKLTKIFSAGQKFALVHHIEKLPATTMFLFYTYGDDKLNAKYSGIVILMSLALSYEMKIENLQRQQILERDAKLFEIVENRLFSLHLSKIHEDQLRPLLTRICNNVIFVNYE
jgi:hypothetical protein